ncbi:MAG: MgtC/SapB family protein [Bacteroidetes bacterium]|nr:MgtC/SapB family protein [Bacteroidota bacterium]
MEWLDIETTLLRIGAAFLLGGIVGFERQWRRRNAGLRTNALVSLGSALFVLISVRIYADDASPSRVASQVVTGIGFLCAGVIMKEGLNIRGLNTAATLWCSAAIGSLAGLGFFTEAIAGTFTIIIAHILLRPLGRIIERGPLSPGLSNIAYKFSIVCTKKSEANARAMLVKLISLNPLQMQSLKSYDMFEENKLIEIVAIIVSPGRHDHAVEEIAGILSIEKGVKNISWEFLDDAHGDDSD